MNLSDMYLIARCSFDFSLEDSMWYDTLCELDTLMPKINPTGRWRIESNMVIPSFYQVKNGIQFMAFNHVGFLEFALGGSFYRGNLDIYTDRIVVRLWQKPLTQFYSREGIEFTVHYVKIIGGAV